jgi:hypothetical protein
LKVLARSGGAKTPHIKLPQQLQYEPLFTATNFTIFPNIAGQGLATGNCHDALKGGEVWWVGV